MFFVVFFSFLSCAHAGAQNFQYVGLLGMWLEKYRLFYVALALCFSVSLVGGWLNESFGQRLRYQRERFGLEGEEGGDKREGKPTCTCGFWIPRAHYCTVMSVSLPLPTVCSVEHIRYTTDSGD